MKTNAIYYREMKMLRPLLRWAEQHPAIVRYGVYVELLYMLYYLFMYA